MSEEAITAEVVRRRAKVRGITIDEERVEEIAHSLEQALAPIRGLDLRAIRLVEPAVGFNAAWSE